MKHPLPDEANLRLLVENIGDVLWFRELPQLRFTYASPAFERIWGRSVEDLRKKPSLWEDSIHPDDQAAVRQALNQWLTGKKSEYNVHYRILGRRGQIRWLADRGIILARKNGKPYQVGGVARDITERETADATQKRLAAVVENSDDAIVTLDLNGVIQTWNAGAERLFQYTSKDAVGRNVAFLRPPEAADDETVFRGMIKRGRRIEHYETRRRRKDGRVIDVSLSLSPLMDSSGRIIGFSKISRDITERNLDRRMFHRLLEAAPDGFVILDGYGRVRMANMRTEKLFGLPKDQIVNLPFERLLPKSERAEFRAWLLEFLREPQKAEKFRGIQLKGQRVVGHRRVPFPVEISLSHVETPEGPLVIIDITDITERQKAEQIIRELNADLELRVRQRTAELTAQIMARMQLEEEILHISEREQRRIGQDLHDDLGQQLAGAWMMADVLQRLLESDGSPRKAEAGKLCALLQQSLAHTRSLARGLHPVCQEQGGFVNALERLCAQAGDLFRVRCKFECREAPVLHDETAMTHLYRIAQEAVSNAVKHGGAQKIRVRLTPAALQIIDDGSGLKKAAQPQGLGLRIMRYRAEMAGYSLSVENGRRGGVVVTCRFSSAPLKSVAAPMKRAPATPRAAPGPSRSAREA